MKHTLHSVYDVPYDVPTALHVESGFQHGPRLLVDLAEVFTEVLLNPSEENCP